MKLPKSKVYHTDVKTKKGNEKIIEHRYDLTGKGIDKDDLDKLVKEHLKSRIQKEGPLRVSVAYTMDKTYATDFVQVNTAADVDGKLQFDSEFMQDYDSDVFDTDESVSLVSIYSAKAHGQVGKNDKNDCLYDALCTAFQEKPAILRSPETFKQFLGVDRCDLIDLKLLPKIENKLKMNIVTTGQYEYMNRKQYPRIMKINIRDDHVGHVYAIDSCRQFYSGYMKQKKRHYPIMYKINRKSNTIKLCRLSKCKTGKRIVWTEPITFLNSFYISHVLRFKYFLKEVDDPKDEPEDIIRKEIEKMIAFQGKAFELLGKDSIGTMNPFHCKFKLTKVASQFFYKHAPKSIACPEDWALDEDAWIQKAMTGGLLYCQKGTFTNVCEYDVNSMYPSLLKQMSFLMRQPKFLTIDSIPKVQYKDQYTVFRCIITGYDDRPVSYTHLTLPTIYSV